MTYDQSRRTVNGFAYQAIRIHLRVDCATGHPRKQPDIHEPILMNRPSRLSLLALRQDFSNSWTSGSSSAELGYTDRGTPGVECAVRAPPYHHTAPPTRPRPTLGLFASTSRSRLHAGWAS